MRLRVGQLQQVQQRVDPTAAAERKRMQQAAVAAQVGVRLCLCWAGVATHAATDMQNLWCSGGTH